MRNLMLSILLFTLFLMVLSTVVVSVSRADIFADNKIIYLNDDPNAPQAESVFVNYLDDANEPLPESTFIDANEPLPESAFIDANEPGPESI